MEFVCHRPAALGAGLCAFVLPLGPALALLQPESRQAVLLTAGWAGVCLWLAVYSLPRRRLRLREGSLLLTSGRLAPSARRFPAAAVFSLWMLRVPGGVLPVLQPLGGRRCLLPPLSRTDAAALWQALDLP